MKVFPLLLLLLCVLSFAGTHAQQNGTLPPEEVEALKQIDAKLGVRWNFSVDPCSGWNDTTSTNFTARIFECSCDNITRVCHVVTIRLKTQNLRGSLPGEFGNLTFLQVLDLSRNYITGGFPANAWARLPLQELVLGENGLTGRIPRDIKKIRSLQKLVLENNRLHGPIPAALSRLENLTSLILNGNFFRDKLPAQLGNLNITDLRIDGNNISGKIPDFIGNWMSLKILNMQGTSLAGPFPASFSKLRKLRQLRVSDIKSDGRFPFLGNSLDLERLVLRNCSISSTIPDYIASMPRLKTLDLSFNSFTGEIGSFFGNMKSLQNLYLMNNKLNGSLPSWILGGKKNVDVSNNLLTGLPKDCKSGLKLNLVANYPSSENHLDPCLKSSCQNPLQNYNLSINCGGDYYNEYEDDGSSFGTSTFFRSLSGKWAYSSTGDFVDNENEKYTVRVPKPLNTALAELNMSELYMSARINPLSLKYYGLCLQNGSYNVSLHFAEIVFTDDQTYSSLGRRIFDVSIQGRKVLEDFNIVTEANGTFKPIVKTFPAAVNDSILEIHFQWAGKGTNSIPTKGVYGPLISAISIKPNFVPQGVSESKSKKRLSAGVIVAIVLASCFVIFLASLFLWLFCIKKHPKDGDLKGLNLQSGSYTLGQIKSATGNFDPAYKIGEGGFGSVYKGVLPDGTVIAVKQLSSKSRQGSREFVNEIGVISALQHPNLVKLFGCCAEGTQLLLIYEYMENNSLARALFGPEGVTLKLDWQRRRKICLDVATGLAYLHEECRIKIVHRDVKATNILLDKDLNAKISDFGLAKLHDNENSHITTRVAGTRGYMAPEYAMRGHLTEKADVYSYGIVVLEIISGKANFKFRPEEYMQLLDWAYVLCEQNKLLDLVDSDLGTDYPKEEVERMLNLALVCTSTSPQDRPAMSAVISMIESGAPIKVPANNLQFEADQRRLESAARESHGISSEGPYMDSSAMTASTNLGTTSESSPSPLISERAK